MNIKEKDLVKRALVAADSVTQDVKDAVSSIQELTQTVSEIQGPSDMIASSTSVDANTSKTVLSVTGAGELHLYHIFGNTRTSSTSDRATAEIIFDDSFSMYIPVGNYEKDYDTTRGWKGDGLFLVYDYLEKAETYSSSSTRYASLSYKVYGNSNVLAYFPFYRIDSNSSGLANVFGESGDSNAGVLVCVAISLLIIRRCLIRCTASLGPRSRSGLTIRLK